MRGIVVHKEGLPVGNSFTIRGADGKEYIAHIGDLDNNEQFLYYHNDSLDDLKQDEEVEFDIELRPHAIHVKHT